MTTTHQPQALKLENRLQAAVAELQATIHQRYPTAVFELTRSPEDPSSLHLIAIVDVDDPDEVGDLVLDRIIDLNVNQGIPLHLIPVRTPERIDAEKESRLLDRRRADRKRSALGLS